MYWKHYGLAEDPFGLSPDSRFLYQSEALQDVLATLQECVEGQRGFAVLTSAPGLGKTTLLFHFLELARRESIAAFVFQTSFEPIDILRLLMKELGLDSTQADVVTLHQQFENALGRIASTGKRFILVVDEAQNLSPSALETIRLLANFETARQKLVQIVLSGHAELETLLAQPGMEHIRQRVAAFCRITPLKKNDAQEYILHRLRVAGGGERAIFTSDGVQELAELSKGIPRLINIYGFQAMMRGSRRGLATLDRHFVRKTVSEFEGWPEPEEEVFAAPGWKAALPAVEPPQAEPIRVSRPEAGEAVEAPMESTLDADPELKQLLAAVHQEIAQREVRAEAMVAAGAQMKNLVSPAPRSNGEFVPSRAKEPVRVNLMMAAAEAAAATGTAPTEAMPAPAAQSIAVNGTMAAAAAGTATGTAPRLEVVPMAEKVAPLPMRIPTGPRSVPEIARPKAAGPKLFPVKRQHLQWASMGVIGLLLLASAWLAWRQWSPTFNRGAVAANVTPSQPPAVKTEVATANVAPPPAVAETKRASTVKPQPTLAGTDRATTGVASKPAAEPDPAEPAQIQTASVRRFKVAEESAAPSMPALATPGGGSGLGAALSGSSQAVTLRQDIQPPVPLVKPAPAFPSVARQSRTYGTVVLHVQVGADGKPTKVTVVSGPIALIGAAQNTVKGLWRFSPATLNGKPVPSETEVRFNFNERK